MKIRQETTDDRAAIWSVNRTAFDSDAEADLVDALREGGFVELSLVAEAAGEITGHILFSRVVIHTSGSIPEALSLAPMAVLPDHQQKGIGSKLVNAGLEACRDSGHRIIVVLGHPGFYRRFGFSTELARRLKSPFGMSEAWMALELASGALADVEGQVVYPEPFRVFE